VISREKSGMTFSTKYEWIKCTILIVLGYGNTVQGINIIKKTIKKIFYLKST